MSALQFFQIVLGFFHARYDVLQLLLLLANLVLLSRDVEKGFHLGKRPVCGKDREKSPMVYGLPS